MINTKSFICYEGISLYVRYTLFTLLYRYAHTE